MHTIYIFNKFLRLRIKPKLLLPNLYTFLQFSSKRLCRPFNAFSIPCNGITKNTNYLFITAGNAQKHIKNDVRYRCSLREFSRVIPSCEKPSALINGYCGHLGPFLFFSCCIRADKCCPNVLRTRSNRLKQSRT